VAIPASGARLILASDGVWDAILPRIVVKAAKKRDSQSAAAAICEQCVRAKQGALVDDTSCAVVDFVPYGIDSFKGYDPLKHLADGVFMVRRVGGQG